MVQTAADSMNPVVIAQLTTYIISDYRSGPIEPTDSLHMPSALYIKRCRKIDVARFVFLNAANGIIVQPVFGREVDKSLPVKAVHAAALASKPVITVGCVVNSPNGRAKFGNDFPFGNGYQRTLAVRWPFGIGDLALALSPRNGTECGNERQNDYEI